MRVGSVGCFALVVGVVVTAATPAVAGDDNVTLIFPFDAAGLPASFDGASEQLARAVADAMNRNHRRAVVATVSASDTAGVLGCRPDSTPCRERMAKTAGAKHLMFGKLEPGSGDVALILTITPFSSQTESVQKAFLLRERTLDRASQELTRQFEGFITGRPTEPMAPLESRPVEPIVPSKPPEPVNPPVAITPPIAEPRSRGGVPTYAWATIGGGVVAAAVGIAFGVKSRALRSEAETARKSTVADLEALDDLQARGVRYTRLANGLMIGGGALAAVGVTLAVLRSKPASKDRSAITVAPAPASGGMIVVVTWGGGN